MDVIIEWVGYGWEMKTRWKARRERKLRWRAKFIEDRESATEKETE